MQGFGLWVQYSVFICDLDRMEISQLRQRLDSTIHHKDDSVVFVDLGDLNSRSAGQITFMGQPKRLPISGPTIV